MPGSLLEITEAQVTIHEAPLSATARKRYGPTDQNRPAASDQTLGRHRCDERCPGDTVMSALQLMQEKDVGALVVLEGTRWPGS